MTEDDVKFSVELEAGEEPDEMEEDDRVRSSSSKKTKGRGHGGREDRDDNDVYESLSTGDRTGPQRSVEGWVIFVTGVHEEAAEEDLLDKFCEYGEVINIQVPLDRRTGFVKGYALLEYAKKNEAAAAIEAMDNTQFMEKTINVDWAFSNTSWLKGRSSDRRSRRR